MGSLSSCRGAARKTGKLGKSVDEELRLVPIGLIDDPAAPLRETMDEQIMGELIGSIMDVGLQVPLRVKQAGERYEVIAGHRRLIACRQAGVELVNCLIDRQTHVSDLAKMVAENTGREEVNPVEEGRLYVRLLREECEGDVDRVVDLVKRPRERVEDRILLVTGDEQVLDAVHRRTISLAAARELNKIGDVPRRRMYLDAAVKSGATARTVAHWRQDSATLAAIELPAEVPPSDHDTPAKIPPHNPFVCMFCGDTNDTYLMELLYLHRQCKRLVLRGLGLDVPADK